MKFPLQVKPLNIKVSPEAHRSLRILCINTGYTQSQLIELMIMNFENIGKEGKNGDATNV